VAEVRWLEGQADEAGPFFLGPDFSLVDATMAPWFLRQVGVLQTLLVPSRILPAVSCTTCRPTAAPVCGSGPRLVTLIVHLVVRRSILD
jgi:hypothetical protein